MQAPVQAPVQALMQAPVQALAGISADAIEAQLSASCPLGRTVLKLRVMATVCGKSSARSGKVHRHSAKRFDTTHMSSAGYGFPGQGRCSPSNWGGRRLLFHWTPIRICQGRPNFFLDEWACALAQAFFGCPCALSRMQPDREQAALHQYARRGRRGAPGSTRLSAVER